MDNGSIYWTHKTTTQCRGLLPHSRKWNFAFWSMPTPLSSPHSSVTKWRSASQENKSILNYVMLFLSAIIYGAYLYQRGVSVTGFFGTSAKGWKITLSWEQKVYFCCDLWQVKCRHRLNKRNPTERAVKAACLIMLRDWGFQLNALNICKYMQNGFFFHYFCVCEHPIH